MQYACNQKEVKHLHQILTPNSIYFMSEKKTTKV
jgi:hypothetical protein